MTGIGFVRSQYDHCVYFRRSARNENLFLLLYVGDILIAGKDGEEVERIKAKLSGEFEMKDMGPGSKLLALIYYGTET